MSPLWPRVACALIVSLAAGWIAGAAVAERRLREVERIEALWINRESPRVRQSAATLANLLVRCRDLARDARP